MKILYCCGCETVYLSSQSGVPVVKARRSREENNASSQPRVVRATDKGALHKAQKSHKTPHTAITHLNPHTLPSHTTRGGDSGGEETGEGGGVRGLDREKLVSILRAYGEYPARYRAFIWRSLLQLPGNHTAYSSLLERGTHPAYANLHRDYPIRSQRLTRVLQRYMYIHCSCNAWNK